MDFFKMFDGSLLLVQVISFLCLFFTLRAFFWKKFLITLDRRKQHLQAEVARIETLQKEAAQLKASYDERLAGIESQAQHTIDEATAEARRQADELRKDAHAQAQDIITSARSHVANELAKARGEMKEQIIDLALLAAEELIDQKMTEEGDKKIVADFLEKMEDLPR